MSVEVVSLGCRLNLSESESLRALLAGMADGVLVVGADGIVRFDNPAARELFGEHARLNFPDGIDAYLEHQARVAA